MVIQNDTLDKMKIERMKNISSIEYMDIVQDIGVEDTKIYPGFMVFFDNGSSLYLTSYDSYFDLFVRRLREVYVQEKDRIVDHTIMGDRGIQIDDFTKKMLLEGKLECASDFYQFYQNKDGYSKRLLFEEDEVKDIFPIIDYHLKMFLEKLNNPISSIQVHNGSNGHYYLTAMKDKEPVMLPLEYKKDGEEYSVQIGNLLNDVLPVSIKVQFLNHKINVVCSVEVYQYYDYFTYSFEQDQVYRERETYWKERCVSYHKENIDMVEDPTNIIKKQGSIQWYPFAWGGYLGLSKKSEDLLSENRAYYIHSTDNYYYEKEISTKEYIDSKRSNYEPIIFDSIHRTMIGIRNEDYLLLENYFQNPCKTGFYKDYLLDNYFYCVSSCKNWGDVKKEECFFLDKKMGIYEDVDLFDIHKVMKKEYKDGNI